MPGRWRQVTLEVPGAGERRRLRAEVVAELDDVRPELCPAAQLGEGVTGGDLDQAVQPLILQGHVQHEVVEPAQVAQEEEQDAMPDSGMGRASLAPHPL